MSTSHFFFETVVCMYVSETMQPSSRLGKITVARSGVVF